MSDADQRSPGAMARQDESDGDCEAREAQERAEAVAFFEQTIVPGFEEAANAINQRAASNASSDEAPAYAEVRQGSNTDDALSVELTVRRGGEVEFWFLGMARMRISPTEWTFRRGPRVKKYGGTVTSTATETELEWKVSMAQTTPERVSHFLLKKYSQVLDARTR
jgi:hypothetical protein